MQIHFLGLAICFLVPLSEGTWHQWRGPARDGALALALPNPLPKSLTPLWQVEVGEGYGSPVGWQNRIFLPVRKQDKEWLVCLNAANGKTVWEKAFEADFQENSYATQYGKGPFATPLVSDGKVVLVTVTGQALCLDAATGQALWSRPFDAALTGERELFCGNTVSPLVMDGHVIIHVGDETHGRMAAYELATGKEVWTWDGDISGYASPVVMQFEGQRQIVSATQNKLVGLDAATGSLLWEFPWQVRWRENIVMPIQHGEGIIVSGREQGQILKLTVKKNDRAWVLETQWKNDTLAMYMSSPVLVANRLFGFSHKLKGHYFCLDATNGALIWQGDGRMGQNAVLLRAKNHVLGLSTTGDLIVLPFDGGKFAPLAAYKVSDQPVWAHPLFLESIMIVKGKTRLTAWQL